MAIYGELHAHSTFSFLDGASDPEELVIEAARLELSALALTDHHGLYGVVRFAEAARAAGLATIFGAEVSIDGGERSGVPDPSGDHLVVLARSPEGYRELSTMLSDGHLARGDKGVPVITADMVSRAADWTVLTGCRKGPITRALEAHGPRAAGRVLDEWRERLGDRLVMEIWDHGYAQDRVRNDALVELALARQMRIVATGNVHYATPSEFRRAQLMAAIRSRRTLDELEGWLPASPLACLRSDSEQRRRFARWPQVVDAAGDLAQELAFDLRLVAPSLPDFPTPRGQSEQEYLRELVEAGATRRYGPRESELVSGAWRQIDHELSVIEQMGFAGYFLIVWDITEFCRRRNILCQGRGSAANSAACYSLGITNADAVRLNLFFERFLSTARDGPPDIDVDIESGRREEVIQYVYERYGRRHAAQVAAVITYRPRSAVRDVAAALDRPHDDALTVACAQDLLHRPRHLGLHSAGMVICDRPIVEVCPVEWARTAGRTVLQWDKDDCAAIGLVKFDLLGLGMLEALHRTMDVIAQSRGVQIDLGALPQEAAVYDLLCEADTVGLFQVESRAQMATLPRVQPRCFYDLVIEVALIRPGPIQGQSVNPYIRRRRGEEPVTYLHPRLEPILRRTLGVPLFQEQLMEMAVAVAGFSPAEADELRQAMAAKRSEVRMARLHSRFFQGMATNGIVGHDAENLWNALSAFANFGFPESHSVSFAHLVYCSAWLKLHYPDEFLVGLLNAQPLGFWSPQSLIADAQRHGVVVARPDVQHSDALARIEGDEEGRVVRLGLQSVRGISSEIAERLAAGRPWANVEDLVRRGGVRENHLTALAAAGALDGFGSSRREMVWRAGAASQSQRDRLPGVVTGLTTPPLATPSEMERLADDVWAMGLTPDRTVMHLWRDALRARGVIPASHLMAAETNRVLVAGVVTHRQQPESARGAVFLNLEDETGHVNVVFSRGAWQRFRHDAASPILLIRGRLERAQGTLNVVAEHVTALSSAPTAPARDFR